MKKAGMLTTFTLLAAGLLLSPPASANERDARYEAPSPDFVLVTQLTWTDKDEDAEECNFVPDVRGNMGFQCVVVGKRKVVMQQWESEAQDVYVIRTFSPNSFILGSKDDYKRTYRGDDVWKPRPQFKAWQWWYPDRTSEYVGDPSAKELIPPKDEDSMEGFSLRFKRSNLKNGKYTVLFTDRDFTPAQWRCSIYSKDVCRWSEGWTTVNWDAYTFDVKKRTISKLREKGDLAFSPKQFQKQLGKVLNRK